jgi:hypothetical protein
MNPVEGEAQGPEGSGHTPPGTSLTANWQGLRIGRQGMATCAGAPSPTSRAGCRDTCCQEAEDVAGLVTRWQGR